MSDLIGRASIITRCTQGPWVFSGAEVPRVIARGGVSVAGVHHIGRFVGNDRSIQRANGVLLASAFELFLAAQKAAERGGTRELAAIVAKIEASV